MSLRKQEAVAESMEASINHFPFRFHANSKDRVLPTLYSDVEIAPVLRQKWGPVDGASR